MASTETREAKARAKATKAEAKALRPWYKKKRFAGPLALFVLIAVAASSQGGGDTGAPQTEAAVTGSEEATEEAEVTAVGEAARDGKFEFTVTSYECGATEVGDEFIGEQAQGQYCLLGVTVTNIGDESQMLLSSDQYLLDDQGRKFSADDMATLAHAPSGDAFFSEINPGNTVSAEIVFDVPADASIVEARLHDSALSGGVVVPVQ